MSASTGGRRGVIGRFEKHLARGTPSAPCDTIFPARSRRRGENRPFRPTELLGFDFFTAPVEICPKTDIIPESGHSQSPRRGEGGEDQIEEISSSRSASGSMSRPRSRIPAMISSASASPE